MYFCAFFGSGLACIFEQIVKEASKTNLTASRHIIKERTSLPVVVGRSKTSLLKLPNSNVRGVSYLLVLMYTKCNSPRSHGGLREEKRKMAGDDGDFLSFHCSHFACHC